MSTTDNAHRAIMAVKELHRKSDHQRWVGFPRADTPEYYCLEDQQSWPCDTRQAITLELSK